MRVRLVLFTALSLPLLFTCPVCAQAINPTVSAADAVPAVKRALQVPASVASLIRYYGLECAPQSMAAGLGSASEDARRCSLVGLAWIGTPSELPAVLSAVDAPDRHGMRYLAITAATRIGDRSGGLDPKTRDHLISMAKGMLVAAKPNLGRLEAVELMGCLGDLSGGEVVFTCLQDDGLADRARMVAREFAKMSATRPNSGPTTDWVTSKSAVLRDKGASEWDRIYAVIGLVDVGTPRGWNVLRAARDSQENERIRAMIDYAVRREDARVTGAPLPKY